MSSAAIGAWRAYEPFLSVAMDDAEARLGLSRSLGHPWRQDPPHLVSLRGQEAESRWDQGRDMGAGASASEQTAVEVEVTADEVRPATQQGDSDMWL